MKTVYETEIGIEKKIIILTTKTVEFLLSKNPDSLSLYMFYIKNAKIQKTNSIFNVESFGMKGLGWGRDRYRSAKRILIDEKFIEDLVRRNDQGKILGHYLKINYLFSEDTISDTLSRINHPVVESIGGKEETNALSNKTINALSNKTETSTTKVGGEKKLTKKEIRENSPFIFKEELELLGNSKWKPHKIVYNYFLKKGMVFENRKQFDEAVARFKKPAIRLEGYSAQQINKTMDYLENKNLSWTLETIAKNITEVANRK